MKLNVLLESKTYAVDLESAVDISLPLSFDGAQPNAYGVGRASARAVESAGFIGDTRRGGSCNCEEYTLIPHCHGTHTEGVGHLLKERLPIGDIISNIFTAATLVSVTPERGDKTTDTYTPTKGANDVLITRASMEQKLSEGRSEHRKALIIRTLPNDASKRSRDYSSHESAYISREAMAYIVSLGVEHLLVDIPSVDRLHDEGKLTCHHIYWNIEEGTHTRDHRAASAKTITELIYVPQMMADGVYFLSLTAANFVSDAAPSRAVLYPLKELHK